MKIHNKLLVLVLAALLLSSLTVQGEVASNVLELDESISVSGDIYQNEVLGTLEFNIEKIWHDPIYDVDILEMSRDFVHTPPLDPIFNVSREIVTSALFNNNRTVFLPAASYHVESGEDITIVFIDISDDLNITGDDLQITYNGVTYILDDLDPYHPDYAEITKWLLSWAFGNVFELQLMPLTMYAISPQATTGQNIDFGEYLGEVIGFTEHTIGDESYEVIEVHHEEEVVSIDIFGQSDPYTIGETTLLYEKNTGMILHWMEYNSSTEEYYYFNATAVTGLTPINGASASFIAVLSTVIIAIPIVLIRRKKK